jgi:putative ABC transport system permease protein
LIHRLVFENLKHRWVRTLVTLILIGLQVTIILALVGVSHGVLAGMKDRANGTGADIVFRAPDSSVVSMGISMPEKIVDAIRSQPHVKIATGIFVQSTGFLDSVTGIHLDEFNSMSGGLVFTEGHAFQGPDDIVVDDVFAQQRKLKPGSSLQFGHNWRVTGIVESGKLSRAFADIDALRDTFSETGKVSMVYIKVDNPINIDNVLAELEEKFPTYKIFRLEDFTSQFTVNSVPYIEPFTRIVIAVAAGGGFLAVLLAMYTAVLERTREIGILKAMGASPGYILGILLRETIVLALGGTLLGIVMAFGSRALLGAYAPNFPQLIVPEWYPWVALISLTGALLGALLPGLKAARQDAIEALAYD